MRGVKTLASRQSISNSTFSGRTPMMVYGVSSRLMVDPRTPWSPPYLSCQNRQARTATGGADGLPSASPNNRPNSASNPSMGRRFGVARAVRIRRGFPPPLTNVEAWVEAPMAWKALVSFRQALKSGMDTLA